MNKDQKIEILEINLHLIIVLKYSTRMDCDFHTKVA